MPTPEAWSGQLHRHILSGYSNLQFGYWGRQSAGANCLHRARCGRAANDQLAPARAAHDAVIVGSGVAGALVAKRLGLAGKQVLVLEAGGPVPPNINAEMNRFYLAVAKVPESAYKPEVFTGSAPTDRQLCRPAAHSAGAGELRGLARSS